MKFLADEKLPGITDCDLEDSSDDDGMSIRERREIASPAPLDVRLAIEVDPIF